MAKTQQNKLLPILGIGIAGYGAYLLYKKKKEEELPPTPPDDEEPPYEPPIEPEDPTIVLSTDTFPIMITDPIDEKWSVFLPHTIDVSVTNPYDVKKRNLYVGMSMMEHATGRVLDFPLVKITISAGATKRLAWGINPVDVVWHQIYGHWWVITATWWRDPTGTEDTRLSEDRSQFFFGIIG